MKKSYFTLPAKLTIIHLMAGNQGAEWRNRDGYLKIPEGTLDDLHIYFMPRVIGVSKSGQLAYLQATPVPVNEMPKLVREAEWRVNEFDSAK
jgi:hypothetical protein